MKSQNHKEVTAFLGKKEVKEESFCAQEAEVATITVLLLPGWIQLKMSGRYCLLLDMVFTPVSL